MPAIRPATAPEIEPVRTALQNQQYSWRTVKGIATEANLSLATVKRAIRALGDEVIKSEIPSANGEDLFAAAGRYYAEKPKPADAVKVIEAMQDGKYTWRTLRGLSAATGLDEAAVLEVIRENRESIVQSEIPSEAGEDLYTTRDHYLDKSGPVSKMLGFYSSRLL